MENPYEISAADHRIITEPAAGKKSLVFIRLAVIFSCIYIVLDLISLLILVSVKVDQQAIFQLLETFICVGLIIGLILKSRFCAIILFVVVACWEIYSAIDTIAFTNKYLAFSILFAIVIFTPIFLGIPGTFAYHKHRKSLPKDPDSLGV